MGMSNNIQLLGLHSGSMIAGDKQSPIFFVVPSIVINNIGLSPCVCRSCILSSMGDINIKLIKSTIHKPIVLEGSDVAVLNSKHIYIIIQ